MKRIKQKNLIIIAVLITIMSAVFFLIINPTVDYIKNTKGQIKIEREELETRYKRVIYQRQNAEKVKKIKEQLSVLDDMFLISEQELKFITTLELVAEKNNISQKINLKSANSNDSKQVAFPFIISASGTAYDILSFLMEIEQLSYYINFNSLKINTKSANNELDAVFNGEVYVLN
ncbi:MAG: hypothetical protein ABIC82_04520 [bacterium]